jgi:hypothetical protein
VQDVIRKLGIDENGVRRGNDDKADRRIAKLRRQRARTRQQIKDRRESGESVAGLPSRVNRLTQRIRNLRKG